MSRLTIRRQLNNNVVEAIDEQGARFVLMGRGIGHGRVPGDPVPERLIEQTFVSEGGYQALRSLARLVNAVPQDVMLVAGEAVKLAHTRLGVPPSQSLLLPLADHLSFALQRHRDGVEFTHPLRWEVHQLYPTEEGVAEDIVALIRQRLNVALPRDEVTAFALHLVSAQFGQPDYPAATRMTKLIQLSFERISARFGLNVDQDSVSAGRFVTHLRYLFLRLVPGTLPGTARAPSSITTTVQNSYPEAMQCSTEIAHDIQEQTGVMMNADELLYLALHVQRLVDSNAPGSASI